ncbi:hypothetical protein HDU93_004264 [Gonapodya sp. JEL0774]|nr:hypothetical protein HDU93_004264 [Gonapodya sp. JEL0774]
MEAFVTTLQSRLSDNSTYISGLQRGNQLRTEALEALGKDHSVLLRKADETDTRARCCMQIWRSQYRTWGVGSASRQAPGGEKQAKGVMKDLKAKVEQLMRELDPAKVESAARDKMVLSLLVEK